MIAGGAALAISAVCVPFVTPALRRACLPYVPATDAQVSNVIRALDREAGAAGAVSFNQVVIGMKAPATRKTYPKGTLVDIGSGDGRIVK